MLSYCSSEAVAKEDKANSKAYETMMVELALWPPTQALVTKALLVREASWLGWPLRDNSWDLSLLNSFPMSSVAKSADSSKAVIFIPQTWSSIAHNIFLALSFLEYARGPQERKPLTMDSNLAKQSSRDSPGFWEKVWYYLL
jgi:hypothetical protein